MKGYRLRRACVINLRIFFFMDVRNETQFWLSTTVYFVFLDKLKFYSLKARKTSFNSHLTPLKRPLLPNVIVNVFLNFAKSVQI